jgi:tRNA (cmo5U34)-methyltransferase
MNGFDDPAAVARYAENPPRLVPGFGDLQRMTRLLLAERAPADGRILVIGAGGGLELRAFAEAQPRWRFVGVDPSAEMLRLAGQTLGPLAARVEWHEGYIASAPTGPFDGASCLLTMHFVPVAERVSTLAEIRRRLKPGAPFVVAHHSVPEGEARDLWFDRFGAFAADNGVAFDLAAGGARVLGDRLPILPPEAEIALLGAAGFTDPQLFYAAFTFRGWVAYA